jgi:hypothetical protein
MSRRTGEHLAKRKHNMRNLHLAGTSRQIVRQSGIVAEDAVDDVPETKCRTIKCR